MKKTFKGILALFLALALLCAAIPAASAEVEDIDGKIFNWNVDEWEVMTGSLHSSGSVRNTFYLVPSDDVIANASITLDNYSGYDYPCLEIYDFNDNLLYKLDGSTDRVLRQESFMLKGGETYTIVAFERGYKPFDASYRISLSKKSDLNWPNIEDPTESGGGGAYLWNGVGTETYNTHYASNVQYKVTSYYIAQDCTFNFSFDVTDYGDNMGITINGPGYSQTYIGYPINTVLRAEAGDNITIIFGSGDPLPEDFALNVTLTPVA